ncbi:MAG: adenylosuccinate synthetase [bacterium]|nr:adenylosuccinate synthetase [bacterium]
MKPSVFVVGSYNEEDDEVLQMAEFLATQEDSNAVIGIVRVCLTDIEEDFFYTIENSNIDVGERMPFRKGWLDLPFLSAICHSNGFTKLALLRMDILGEKPLIRLCVSYEKDVQAEEVAEAEPIHEDFLGWGEIRGCCSRDDLPNEAQKYLEWIEAVICLPVCCISSGSGPGEVVLI